MKNQHLFNKALAPAVVFNQLHWDYLSSHFQKETYKRGEFFVNKGDVCNRIGVITKGSFHGYLQPKQKLFTNDIFLTNEVVCGFRSYFTQQSDIISIQAISAATVYTIEREVILQFENQFFKNQPISNYWLTQLYLKKEKQVRSLLILDAENKYKQLQEDRPDIEQLVPSKYIAKAIGVTPEFLCRLKKRLFIKNN